MRNFRCELLPGSDIISSLSLNNNTCNHSIEIVYTMPAIALNNIPLELPTKLAISPRMATKLNKIINHDFACVLLVLKGKIPFYKIGAEKEDFKMPPILLDGKLYCNITTLDSMTQLARQQELLKSTPSLY